MTSSISPTAPRSPTRSCTVEKKFDSTLFSRVAGSGASTAAEMAPLRCSSGAGAKGLERTLSAEISPLATIATHPARPGGAILGLLPARTDIASSNASLAPSALDFARLSCSNCSLRASTYSCNTRINSRRWYSYPLSIDVDAAGAFPTSVTLNLHTSHSCAADASMDCSESEGPTAPVAPGHDEPKCRVRP